MEISINGSLTDNELWQRALGWSVKEWNSNILQCPLGELPVVVQAASLKHDPHQWQIKTRAIIHALTDRQKLESAGRGLAPEQVIEVLNYSAEQPHIIEKLSPLFVGMPHATFLQVLALVDAKQLEILKQEALTESIQHHITLACHELCSAVESFVIDVALKEEELRAMSLEGIRSSDVQALAETIGQVADRGEKLVLQISHVLAVAWKTDRSDLITALSDAKELCQRCILSSVGHGSSEGKKQSSTGLWAVLESRLNSVYVDGALTEAIGRLRDDEPASEALAIFSLWYPEDYWHMGLLPQFLKLDDVSARENHFSLVQKNLALLGLHTIGDLKRSCIFSKRALYDYIKHNNR